MINYTLDHTLVWLYIILAAVSLFAALNLTIYVMNLKDKYFAVCKELRRYKREEAKREAEEWSTWMHN